MYAVPCPFLHMCGLWDLNGEPVSMQRPFCCMPGLQIGGTSYRSNYVGLSRGEGVSQDQREHMGLLIFSQFQ